MPKKPTAKPYDRKQSGKTIAQSEDLGFESVAEGLLGERGVTPAKMFGSHGLKINGKVFSMLVKDTLVVKLPRKRVDALVKSSKGDYFDPGHGRIMTEWIAVNLKSKPIWKKLAREAMMYVDEQNRRQ